MKKFLTLCALVVWGLTAHAGTNLLVKISSAAVDSCRVTASSHAALVGTTYPITATAFNGQRGCAVDVSSVPAGAFNISVAPYSSTWGVLGVASPFSSTRPTSNTETVESFQLAPF